MNRNLISVFFLPLILPISGILRPSPADPNNPVSDSDRRQGNPGNPPRPFVSRPIVNPPNNGNPNFPQQQQQPQQPNNAIQPPSRELLPPLVSPVAPAVQSNALPPEPAQSQPPQSPPGQDNEKFELLPPVEIPPEFPIDNPPSPPQPPQQQQQPNRPGAHRPIVFESPSTSVNQFIPPPSGPQPPNSQGRQPSSLLPTTGSGGSFANGIPNDAFSNSRPGPERPSQRPTFQRTTTQPTPDPGLDCLGTCDCPSDFTFVCGSNRFLYQNDCALECDKRCHPGLVKLDMSECS